MKKWLVIVSCILALCACQREEPVQKPAPEVVKVVAFGDFMLHRPQLNAAKSANGYDFKGVFTQVKPYIDWADVAMINLETTLTGGEKGYTTFPVFSSPHELAQDLKDVGFDVVATANNHAYDKLGEGTERTVNYLKDAGLDVIGTQTEKTPPLVKEVNGIRIGFLSYTYGLNGFDELLASSEKPYAVRVFSDEALSEDIAALKEAGVDAIICYMHWGEEYQNTPTDTQKSQAKALADAGVDLVFGSHPHVPQGIDNIQGTKGTTYVAYSMGNFVSNQRRENMNDRRVEMGQMVLAELTKDEHGTRVTGFEPTPTYVDKYYENGLHYEVIPVTAVLNGAQPLPRLESIREKLEGAQAHFKDLVDENLILKCS